MLNRVSLIGSVLHGLASWISCSNLYWNKIKIKSPSSICGWSTWFPFKIRFPNCVGVVFASYFLLIARQCKFQHCFYFCTSLFYKLHTCKCTKYNSVLWQKTSSAALILLLYTTDTNTWGLIFWTQSGIFLLSDFIARTYLIKFFFTSKRKQWLLTLTSIRSAPFTCTEAWCFLQAEIFIMGAFNGITTVTGIPRSLPWYDNARAWFPADAAITPFSFCSYGKVKLSLKWTFSAYIQDMKKSVSGFYWPFFKYYIS